MKPAVTDKNFRDGFHLDIIKGVTFDKSKAFAGALKRLQHMGFTESDAKNLLGKSNV